VLYKQPTLLDAAHYIQETLSVIKMDTIINCFVSADFIYSLAEYGSIKQSEMNKMVSLLKNCSLKRFENGLNKERN